MRTQDAISLARIDSVVSDGELHLTLAAESANAGLWELDLATGAITASEKARELIGAGAEDGLSLDVLLGLMHADDLEKFRCAIGGCRERDARMRDDFRIRLGDGSFRWVNFSASRAKTRIQGEPGRILGVVLDVTDRKQMEEELETILAENAALKKRLSAEHVYQREELEKLQELSSIVGQSRAIQMIFHQIEQVGPTESPVLITGETGTGKELVSRAIHAASKRRDRILVIVNCATLPASLIESELFGREKGAYTGALTRQIGRFELANGGTLLLDEIGELPVELQGKLLRVLQEGEFERLGNPKTIRVNVRLIAATNRNLIEAVEKGTFRKDLYYRLSVFPIELPPLREHAEDIPLLAWAFVDEFNRKMGKRIVSIPSKTMESLKKYSWLGNVRELRNTIEHAMIISRGDCLEMQLPDSRNCLEPGPLTFEQVMHRSIMDALRKTEWRIKGPHGAAALLGLRPSTLYTKMKKLNIPLRPTRDAMPS